jgi:hypothetical protein
MTDDVFAIEKFNQSTQQIIEKMLLSHPYLRSAINKIQL